MENLNIVFWLGGIITASILLRPIGRLLPIARVQGSFTAMSLAASFGYVLATVTVYHMLWLYFVKELIFFQWLVHGIIGLGQLKIALSKRGIFHPRKVLPSNILVTYDGA